MLENGGMVGEGREGDGAVVATKEVVEEEAGGKEGDSEEHSVLTNLDKGNPYPNPAIGALKSVSLKSSVIP